jgi:hypothetical protein
MSISFHAGTILTSHLPPAFFGPSLWGVLCPVVDPGLPLHVFKACLAWSLLSRYVNGVTASVCLPKPHDSAGDSQIGIPLAQADPLSLGNVTVVRVRSACARPGWGPEVTGPPSENWVKTFCLACRWAEKALPISCLFCAPTAGISRQSKATPRNSQDSGRKEVRLK